MNIFERLFRNTLDHSGDANEMIRETLQPTERELLEAEAAWWKDSAAHWRAELDKESDENYAILKALVDIRIYTRDQKSGTAQKVHRMCKDALK